MPQIQAGTNYNTTNNRIVTASNLNNHVNNAVLVQGVITEQSPVLLLDTADQFLIHDNSAGELRKTTIGDIVNSNYDFSFKSLSGVAGFPLTITPDATVDAEQKLVVNGDTEINGDLFLNGTFTIPQFTLPSGTTEERPETPVAGSQRFNTETNRMEFYNGTVWVNVVQASNTESQTGWIFQGYKKIEITGNLLTTNSSGVGSAAAYESESFSIPESEYWLPVSEFSQSTFSKSLFTFEQAINWVQDARWFASGFDAPLTPNVLYNNNFAAVGERKLEGKYIYLKGELAPQYHGPVNAIQDIFTDAIKFNYDVQRVGFYGVQQAFEDPSGDNHYLWLSADFVKPYWKLNATNEAEFYVLVPRASALCYEYIMRFKIVPSEPVSPDPVEVGVTDPNDGVIWIQEKGYRGGQTIKIVRPAFTFDVMKQGSFTQTNANEKFVLWFERWRKV